jgi:glycerophosphoryl diester phosphodiesterase
MNTLRRAQQAGARPESQVRRHMLLFVACVAVASSVGAVASVQNDDVGQRLAPADLSGFFDCLRETGRTIVAAHRGGPGSGFPENAISTFENTLRQGPAVLEIDIARTRDGVLILMHDETVDRTTTGTGRVSNLTLSELQTLRLKDRDGLALDVGVPTLREALDWSAGRTVLELDVNNDVPFAEVIAEVRAAGAVERVVVITYNDDAAVRVHELAPASMISVSIDAAADLDALVARGVDLTRVLAWTGVEEPNAALNVALARRGVEAMFGTLGNPARSWDGRFIREGRDQYAKLAATGLALISSDRPIEAVRDLDAQDGVEGYAALRCAAAR